MRTYLIAGNQITVVTSSLKSPPEGATVVRHEKDLFATPFTLKRLLNLWNAIPGAERLERFQSRSVGAKRIWRALRALPSQGRSDSKQARVIALLQRSGGATIDNLMSATGWQRHTVRGVLAGAIKRKLKLPLIATRSEIGTTYRIAA